MQIDGILDPYFETGTEGILWSVYDESRPGYDGLFVLEDGDLLEVIDNDGTVVWEGEIELDWDIGYKPYPSNPKYGQQAAMGAWVHGIQKGFKPDDWALLFFRQYRNKEAGPYMARLTRS